MSVSQLAGRLEAAVASGVPGSVRVVGEIGQAKQRTHWYFSLKDDGAVVDAVMWASTARRTNAVIAGGDRVVVRGRVEFYKPQGRVTLVAESVEPEGEGDLNRRLRMLIEEARGLGWLDPARKRPPPVFPRRIAVITSRTGAALQDVIDTARRRCPAVDLLVVDALVQGDRAAGDVAGAIDTVNARRDALGVEAILLTRGGGSLENLWAFNERVVAEAVVRSVLPVVAAIGHESDTTLAELVADERAATPTQAAMRLTPDRDDLLRQAAGVGRRLGVAVGRRLDALAHRLELAEHRGVLADPLRLISDREDRLVRLAGRLHRAASLRLRDRVGRLLALGVRLDRARPDRVLRDRIARLERAAVHLADVAHVAAARGHETERARSGLRSAGRRLLETRRARLDRIAAELEAVGPMAVLERGYSVTTDADGRVVRSAATPRDGERLVTRFADGSLESVVARSDGSGHAEGAVAEAGAAQADRAPAASRTPSRARPPRVPGDADDQMDLFSRGG